MGTGTPRDALLPPGAHAGEIHHGICPSRKTFRLTGPVTLTFSINGRSLDRVRYEKPGEQQYTHQVPPEFLKPQAINIVGVEPDKVAAPNPGEKLSFLLIRAGFTE